MERIFKEEEKSKPKMVNIYVTDTDLKMFLHWLMINKGTISEFTRRAWKKTAEYEEYSRLENKERLREEVEK